MSAPLVATLGRVVALAVALPGSTEEVAAQRAVVRAFDPRGLLGPGVLLPGEQADSAP